MPIAAHALLRESERNADADSAMGARLERQLMRMRAGLVAIRFSPNKSTEWSMAPDNEPYHSAIATLSGHDPVNVHPFDECYCGSDGSDGAALLDVHERVAASEGRSRIAPLSAYTAIDDDLVVRYGRNLRQSIREYIPVEHRTVFVAGPAISMLAIGYAVVRHNPVHSKIFRNLSPRMVDGFVLHFSKKSGNIHGIDYVPRIMMPLD
jgi:hypothetical protein